MDIKEFKIPIYPATLIVAVTKSFIEAGNQFKFVFNEDDEDNAAISFRGTERGPKMYFMFLKDTHVNDFAVVAHESLHITNMILQDVCVIPSFENDEAQAYLLSHVVGIVLETIEINKNRKIDSLRNLLLND